MAIEGLNKIFGIQPVKKEKEPNLNRKKKKKDDSGKGDSSNESSKDEKKKDETPDRTGRGRIDIRI